MSLISSYFNQRKELGFFEASIKILTNKDEYSKLENALKSVSKYKRSTVIHFLRLGSGLELSLKIADDIFEATVNTPISIDTILNDTKMCLEIIDKNNKPAK